MNRPTLTLCLVLLLGAFAGLAHAQPRGLLLAPSALPAASRAALSLSITRMRRERPELFAAVARLEREAPRLQASARGRAPVLTPLLRALGPDALLPMLELLAFSSSDAQATGPATRSSQSHPQHEAGVALRVALLEAVGHLRDARAFPVLSGVLEQSGNERAIMRAAAFALGALGTDLAAQRLVTLARSANGDAVRAGMGSCRRAPVAEDLARALAREARPDVRRTLIDSLAEVGNAWAFRTRAVMATADEQARIRSIAARALLEAFVHDTGNLRDAADNALMVVDAADTPALIASARARSSDAELRAALDRLATRLDRNPTR